MIKRGLNNKNIEYWKKEIFIRLHGEDSTIAELKAYSVCSGQEIDMLKARIIKLETNVIQKLKK